MKQFDQETEKMLKLVEEINHLAALRRALALGTNTGERNSAESTLSRKISHQVNDLARKVLSYYKDS